ncbi:MAG: glycine cleavage T C-terminal barrel domain-containing protein, partial [Myxococcota bacterium]
QKAKGVPRRLIGFRITGRGIARSGYAIRDAASGAEIGRVTSGTKGPTVGAAIGLGYVPPEHAAAGSELIIDCRGKDAAATVVKGKFYRRKRSS